MTTYSRRASAPHSDRFQRIADQIADDACASNLPDALARAGYGENHPDHEAMLGEVSWRLSALLNL